MIFNSYQFWVFFAIVMVLYRLLPHRGQNRMLLVASYIFYGTWDWRFLLLLGGTTLVDYFAALFMVRSRSKSARRSFLLVSIFANLGILGFFKYCDFFSHEMMHLLQSLGIHASLPLLNVVLPVGISFYTFQELSYTISVYRGEVTPVRNLLDFALYVAFFPQLVAGPIERSGRLIPQILNPRQHHTGDFAKGLYLVLTGLFRKIVIADNMASFANAVFARNPAQLTGVECLLGVYAFALQIYGDFSGYSAIAQGIARWMGFDLMTNFRMPYLAVSPSDFWRRWHISLSTWLRDYLYIPLGGNRGGKWPMYRNLMITMLLGGLWHGASWTFIAWGAYHGLLLCLYRPFEGRRPKERSRLHPITILRMLIMFHLVCLGWLLFRADTMTQAWGMFARIFNDFRLTHFAIYAMTAMGFFSLPFLLYECWVEKKRDMLALVRISWIPRAALYVYLLLMLEIFPSEVAHAFIYFQF